MATSLRHLWPLGPCLIASAVMQAPFTSYRHFASALSPGDGRAEAWVLAWMADAMAHGRPLFDANMFYPTPRALTHIDPMVSLGAVALPFWLATGNAIVVFNLLKLAGPALSAWGAFHLAHAWTGDRAAALVAGIAFGCSSFTLLHNAHINLTWSVGIPVAIVALERWWQTPTWPRLALWWIAAIFTALVSWYLALIVGVALALWLLWLAASPERARSKDDFRQRVVQLMASGLLAVAVLLPFAAPYFARSSAAGEAAAFAATWQSYLVPHEFTMAGRWLVAEGLANPQGIWGEKSLFLGWTLLALALVGLGVGLRQPSTRRRAAFLGILAAAAAALSFGPSASGLAPFDLVLRLPGAGGFRATARLGLLVVLACAMLAAIGLAWLSRLARRGRAALMAACLVLVMGEVFVLDFPGGRPNPEAMPEVYRLAVQDDARAAAALPMYAGESYWFLEADYLLYSTAAGFLPLANGFGRWAPDAYLTIGAAMRSFPSQQSAATLKSYGVTHVILHGSRYGLRQDDVIRDARAAPDFAVVAVRGSDVLLRVR